MRYNSCMRKLAKYTVDVLTILLLMMCVATVGLWVRSHYVGDRYIWPRTGSQRGGGRELRSASGQLTFMQDTPSSPRLLANTPAGGWEHGNTSWIDHCNDKIFVRAIESNHWNFGPFDAATWNGGCFRVSVEHWVLAVATGVLPIARGLGSLLERRRRMGSASSDGYPECRTLPGTPA
jgi:hypothetical protein